MTKDRFDVSPANGPATVDHVADACQRYPGETITLFTRATVREPLSSLTLRVSLPEGTSLEGYRPPDTYPHRAPRVEVDGGSQTLAWQIAEELAAGAEFEVQARVRIDPTQRDRSLRSRATLTGADSTVLAQETVTLVVRAKGRYLRYLPEIYEHDELMARLLMLFESFWAPIEQQIDSVENIFDPEMTPSEFLPWLASWVDLTFDGQLTEEQRRQLILAAVPLYRKRGTCQGLKEHLEILTGGEAQITEYRARDFKLGPKARLGPAIALGRGNVPHTFSVSMRLPPVPADGAEEVQALEQERRRRVRRIIEREKPAHTSFKLEIEREGEYDR